MIHPDRGLVIGSGIGVGIGAFVAANAILVGAAEGEGSDFAAGGSGADATGADGATAGDCSFLTVVTVVIVVGVASAGGGASCRLSDGSGVRAAVRMLPG